MAITKPQQKIPDGVEIDANIRPLLEVINDFEGIATISSCGGHPDPVTGQLQRDTWHVIFRVLDPGGPGWYALEFLTWFVNNDYARAGHDAHMSLFAAAPHANGPGRSLWFCIEGKNADEIEDLAAWIVKARDELFVIPDPDEIDDFDL